MAYLNKEQYEYRREAAAARTLRTRKLPLIMA